MIGIVLQWVSIIFNHDFNPALTPGLMEDSQIFDGAFQIMRVVWGA